MLKEQSERDLVVSLKTLRAERKAIELKLEEVSKLENAAEALLLDYLESENKNASARYDNGIGYALISKPRIFASCPEEDFFQMKQFLMKEGREDLIKERVMPSSLSAFISERITEGKEIPIWVKYYIKSSIKLY